MRIVKLEANSKKDIMKTLLKRTTDDYGPYEATVKEILANVKENGDKAVFDYTLKFDKADNKCR